MASTPAGTPAASRACSRHSPVSTSSPNRRCDVRADPGQLAGAPYPPQLRDRRGMNVDRLRRATVGAHLERVPVRELEEVRESRTAPGRSRRSPPPPPPSGRRQEARRHEVMLSPAAARWPPRCGALRTAVPARSVPLRSPGGAAPARGGGRRGSALRASRRRAPRRLELACGALGCRPRLRRAAERGPDERLVTRPLGREVRLEQHELAHAPCDAVALRRLRECPAEAGRSAAVACAAEGEVGGS